MADERDPRVTRRYRELGAEEPPPALDEAILAASRQALAPRRRWYLPLAAAAVALLAVGVALQVERQQADPEAVTAPAMPQPSTDEVPAAKPGASTPAAPKVRKREAAPSASPEIKPERQEAARESVQENAPGGLSGRRADESRSRESAPAAAPIPQTAPASGPAPPAAALAERPERWLERIAELRMQGRHDDADKALAEFRKRYPEYRIPESMLEKVERK